MRRLSPVAGGIAVGGLVLTFAFGATPRFMMLLVPAFGLLGAVALVGTRRVGPEHGWSVAVPLVANQHRPGPASVGARPRSTSSQVAVALGRFEARQLALSLWFGVGIAFLLISFVMFGLVYGAENGGHWTDTVDLAPWLAHPLVGMVVLAAFFGITRAERDGADELFKTCPTTPATRTWGALGAAWVPVATLAVFFLVYGVTVAVRSPNLYGAPGADAIAVVLGALVLGVGGVALGVALGRWTRFALAPLVAVVAVGFVSLNLATSGDPGWNPLQQLSSFPPLSSEPPVFTDAPAWSHLAWIVALTGAVVVVAVARHRRDRTVAVLAGVAAVLLVGTGAAATRPMPGPSAARIAGRITLPAEHQTCRPAGQLRVCVYQGNEEMATLVAAEVGPVAAMLPDVALPVTLRQRFGGTNADLAPEVARRLGSGVPTVEAGEMPLDFSSSPGELRRIRTLLGLHAVGLPSVLDPDVPPVIVAGRARGVVALWLATRGIAPERAGLLTSRRTPDDHDCWDPPVAWSAQDLEAARALGRLPEATVRAVVQQGWDRWRQPLTGTDELLVAVGLRPVGSSDAVQDRSQSPC